MDKILSFLGIAQKAGKIESGGFLCEKAVKSRKAKIVILAEDAQKNTVSILSYTVLLLRNKRSIGPRHRQRGTFLHCCDGPGICGWHY